MKRAVRTRATAGLLCRSCELITRERFPTYPPPLARRRGGEDAVRDQSGRNKPFAHIAAGLGPSVVGLGLDLAAAAARRAARRCPGHAFAVADLWAEWPVRDAALDLVLTAFAPKNFP